MHEIEYRPLDKITPADVNPKTHDLDAIERSFARFGFVAPAVVDDATGKLVAGHGRIEALRRLRDRGGTAPKGVFVEGKVWKVPIVVGVNLTEEEARAYLVADNRISEIGGWDYAALNELLGTIGATDVPLGDVGFSADDLRAISVETEIRNFEKEKESGAGLDPGEFADFENGTAPGAQDAEFLPFRIGHVVGKVSKEVADSFAKAYDAKKKELGDGGKLIDDVLRSWLGV